MSIKLPKIHLDSGDPQETRKAKALLGFLDGQTTNPSLVLKNPDAQKYVEQGKKLTKEELHNFYKQIVQEIEKELAGPISVETHATWDSTAKDMLAQAEDMFTWGKNIYIKFPTIPEGLKAAHEFVQKGGPVNMTLVFDQAQAAAVYAATLGTAQPAFVSPFIGRWDDRGYKGLDLVKNIIKMYRTFNKHRNVKEGHVQVLAASIRNMDHFYSSIVMGADILTIPLKTIYDWIQEEKWMPDTNYRSTAEGLHSLIYEDFPLHTDFSQYKVGKEDGTLLDEGLKKFVADWEKLLG